MGAFLTVGELEILFRPLTEDEEDKAAAILPLISDALRQYGSEVGLDLDDKAAEEPTYASLLKMVVSDIAQRVLRQSTSGEAVTSETQSALGYSWQGTLAVPGGGLAAAILYSDLKALGLLRQHVGSISTWGSLD